MEKAEVMNFGKPDEVRKSHDAWVVGPVLVYSFKTLDFFYFSFIKSCSHVKISD